MARKKASCEQSADAPAATCAAAGPTLRLVHGDGELFNVNAGEPALDAQKQVVIGKIRRLLADRPVRFLLGFGIGLELMGGLARRRPDDYLPARGPAPGPGRPAS